MLLVLFIVYLFYPCHVYIPLCTLTHWVDSLTSDGPSPPPLPRRPPFISVVILRSGARSAAPRSIGPRRKRSRLAVTSALAAASSGASLGSLCAATRLVGRLCRWRAVTATSSCGLPFSFDLPFDSEAFRTLSSLGGQSPPRVPHGCLLCRQPAKREGGALCDFALRCKWGQAGLCQALPRSRYRLPLLRSLGDFVSLVLGSESVSPMTSVPSCQLVLLITQLDNLVTW